MADSVDELFPEPQMTEEVIEEPQHVEEPAEVVEPAPEAEPAPEPEPEPEPQPRQEEPQRVPLSVMMEERERRKEAERRIAALEAQQRQEPATIDPFDDPAGFAAQQQEALNNQLWQHTVMLSDQFARQQYGDEATETAVEWAGEKLRTDPAFLMQVRQQANPVSWIVQQHKRDADLSDYQKDPVAFARRILEANGQLSAPVAAPVAAAPTPAPAPARVPRSLASQGSAPSDVRQTASGPLAGVDALFS